MTCPKCGSNSVNIQLVTESKLVTKHHSILWWILIGWWFVPIIWIIFFLPKLLIRLLGINHKRQKIVTIEIEKGICQTCGEVFDIKKEPLD